MEDLSLLQQIIQLMHRHRETRVFWSSTEVARALRVKPQNAYLMLKKLTEQGVVRRTGGGCKTRYRLFDGKIHPGDRPSPKQRLKRADDVTYQAILDLFHAGNPRSAKELASLLGITRNAVGKQLRKLVKRKIVLPVGGQWTRRYYLTTDEKSSSYKGGVP